MTLMDHVLPATLAATIYPPGARASGALAGDVILVDGTDLLARAAQWGERLERRDSPYARWNHVGVFVDPETVVDATSDGVAASALAGYDDLTYVVVHIEMTEAQRTLVRQFLEQQIGDPYGYYDLARLCVALVTHGRLRLPAWRRQPRALFCSELASMALWWGGVRFGRPPWRTTPADIARVLGVGAAS